MPTVEFKADFALQAMRDAAEAHADGDRPRVEPGADQRVRRFWPASSRRTWA
jgi:hypothetical protein